MSAPSWVEADELIEFNRITVEHSGEPFGLIDAGLLDSSVHRPRQILHYERDEDVVRLGVALAVSIAQNHCFRQGNKRTAQAALFRFLWINGYTFRDPDDLVLAELMLAVVEHQISEEEYLAAIDPHVIAR